MLNTIISPENLAYFTAIDAMGQPRECTRCPPNTEQCAHLDGYWVRLVVLSPGLYGPTAPDTPYGVYWSWPAPAVPWGFCYETLDEADEWFRNREAEMRKIAEME